MSSTELSSSASSVVSGNDYLSEYEVMSEIEAEEESQNVQSCDDANSRVSSDNDAFAWADDPIADEEWTAEYEEDIRQNEMLEEKMQKRLNGDTELDEW